MKEQSKSKLDDPLAKYLPAMKEFAKHMREMKPGEAARIYEKFLVSQRESDKEFAKVERNLNMTWEDMNRPFDL